MQDKSIKRSSLHIPYSEVLTHQCWNFMLCRKITSIFGNWNQSNQENYDFVKTKARSIVTVMLIKFLNAQSGHCQPILDLDFMDRRVSLRILRLNLDHMIFSILLEFMFWETKILGQSFHPRKKKKETSTSLFIVNAKIGRFGIVLACYCSLWKQKFLNFENGEKELSYPSMSFIHPT